MEDNCEKDFINEVDTMHGPQIPESVSDKVYNSIVRIEIQDKKRN